MCRWLAVVSSRGFRLVRARPPGTRPALPPCSACVKSETRERFKLVRAATASMEDLPRACRSGACRSGACRSGACRSGAGRGRGVSMGAASTHGGGAGSKKRGGPSPDANVFSSPFPGSRLRWRWLAGDAGASAGLPPGGVRLRCFHSPVSSDIVASRAVNVPAAQPRNTAVSTKVSFS
jgi:hypothetical protein